MRTTVIRSEPQKRRIRDTLDFAELADRVRLPWRFLERHMTMDGLTGF